MAIARFVAEGRNFAYFPFEIGRKKVYSPILLGVVIGFL
jgi:hypothetical protein